jgi:RNA polymerase sigma factor (sigma-70 family)
VKRKAEGEAAFEALVRRAQHGDRAALEEVVKAVLPQIHGLAMRFLWHPQDAEDATQEILARIVTKLGSFRGESAFRTWAFRLACNVLSTLRRARMEERSLTFEGFRADLAQGLSDDAPSLDPPVEQALLWEEVRIGCTMAMLLCLDRDHRLAYILGEILELDHGTAAEVLEIRPATFRQRLARARADVVGLMQARCGLAHPGNPCRCRRRVATAIARRHVDPRNLLFARCTEQARRFPAVLAEIRRLDEMQRAAALQRASAPSVPSDRFEDWLRRAIERMEEH